jgi:hypothetical protein
MGEKAKINERIIDVMHALLAEAVEGEAGAIAPDYLGLLHQIMPLQAEPLYLVLQELMHALPDRLHRRLAGAGNPQRSLGAGLEQELTAHSRGKL